MTARNAVVLACDIHKARERTRRYGGTPSRPSCPSLYAGQEGEELQAVRTASHHAGWRTADTADGPEDYCQYHEQFAP